MKKEKNGKNSLENVYVGVVEKVYQDCVYGIVSCDHGPLYYYDIVIEPKRVLIERKVDSNGEEKFYLYGTDEEVEIWETDFDRSFFLGWQQGSGRMTYEEADEHSYKDFEGHLDPEDYNSEKFKESRKHGFLSLKQSKIGHLVSFSEYIKEKTGKEVTELTDKQMITLLKFFNLFAGKEIDLSVHEEEAKEQLEALGLRKKTEEKKLG